MPLLMTAPTQQIQAYPKMYILTTFFITNFTARRLSTPCTLITSTSSYGHSNPQTTTEVGLATYPTVAHSRLTTSRRSVSPNLALLSQWQTPSTTIAVSKLLKQHLVMAEAQYQLPSTSTTAHPLTPPYTSRTMPSNPQSAPTATPICTSLGPHWLCQPNRSARQYPRDSTQGQTGLRKGSAIVHYHVRYPYPQCR